MVSISELHIVPDPLCIVLKNLSDNVKMELAAMLTTSLAYRDELAEPELTEEEKDREFWSLCGCWKDDPEDAARMEAAIK